MKTVYYNTEHPKRVKWLTILLPTLAILAFVLYLIFAQNDDWTSTLLNLAIYTSIFSFFFYDLKLSTITIDEEEDTLTDSRLKQYPLKLSKLKTAMYKENKKGKFRSLFLHDTGVGFMDLKISKENADKIVAQILKNNPAVEVQHANYI